MRAIIAVMDSVGIGAAPDANVFGDVGSDTLGHIAEACSRGAADGRPGGGTGALHIPHLMALGLGAAAADARGSALPIAQPERITGRYAHAAEISRGKDTPSGHWELMGLPCEFDWGYFPPEEPSFPPALLDRIIEDFRLPGILGNCHASGTDIIARLGEEHIRTGKPICYTSADSVFQIAAHEEHFGLQRLYELCALVRPLVDEHNIGRVIARPFVGQTAADFQRTGNRKDLATPPHAPTLLNIAHEAGREVWGVGKIGDIFAYSGITKSTKANGNDAVMDTLLSEMKTAPAGAIVFANFVDFDSLYGHRRDIPGYASCLEDFDRRLPELQAALAPGDIGIITADHGNDPSWPGSDHTREYVPILAFGDRVVPGNAGRRDSFADLAAGLAEYLSLPAPSAGTSFLS